MNRLAQEKKIPHTTPDDLNSQQKEQKPTNSKTVASNQHCEEERWIQKQIH